MNNRGYPMSSPLSSGDDDLFKRWIKQQPFKPTGPVHGPPLEFDPVFKRPLHHRKRPSPLPRIPYRPGRPGPRVPPVFRFHPAIRALDMTFQLYDIWAEPWSQLPPGFDFPAGWVQLCDRGGLKEGYGRSTSGTADFECQLNSQVMNGNVAEGIPLWFVNALGDPRRYRWVGIGAYHSSLPNRYNPREEWSLRDPPPGYDPEQTVFRKPGKSVPMPQAAPEDLPYPLIPEIPPDHPFRQTGPDPADPDGQDNPYRNTKTGARGQRGGGTDKPTVAKPAPNVRERKTLSAWQKAILQAWGALTEVPDWVGAFWDAFPDPKPKGLLIHEKVLWMIDNFTTVDGEQLIKNVIYNIVEDYIAGRIIGALDSVGVGIGPSGQPYLKQHLLK